MMDQEREREREKRKKGEEPFFGEEGKRERREFTRPSSSQHLLWTKWDDDDDDANGSCNNRRK